MLRFGSVSLFGISLIAFAVAFGNPPDDTPFNNALAVQQAMASARAHLSEMRAKKAVDALEETLPKVNNNPQYLVLMREAYRAHIRELALANQPDQARRYLQRLCILEPSAANDASLRPAIDAPPHKFETEPVKPNKLGFPTWKMPTLSNPFVKKEEPLYVIPPRPTFRAHGEDSTGIDPFDPSYMCGAPFKCGTPFMSRIVGQAPDLLARGANEFKMGRYGEARLCFEQAQQADRTSIDACRDQWAYCIIKGVSEAMEAPGALPAKLPALKKQVEEAIEMAPTKMMKVGQELLQTLDQRAKGAGVSPVAASNIKVRHLGANKEGWHVAESQYFRVFHKQSNELAERVVNIAETTRTTMYRKWFDSTGEDWQPHCELILHPNGAGYAHMTGQANNSPGHARIQSDPSGRVIARRMDLRLDINGMMETVLPHETTHVVLAGNFGSSHVPRWIDEGIAVLSEPNEKIELHRRNLLKNHKEGHTFGLKELMELPDYPHPRRIPAFYAQSVVLVEYLTQQRGPKVFTDFIKDGLRYGYETSLQKHYSMTLSQLEARWQQQVLSDAQRFAATK